MSSYPAHHRKHYAPTHNIKRPTTLLIPPYPPPPKTTRGRRQKTPPPASEIKARVGRQPPHRRHNFPHPRRHPPPPLAVTSCLATESSNALCQPFPILQAGPRVEEGRARLTPHRARPPSSRSLRRCAPWTAAVRAFVRLYRCPEGGRDGGSGP